MKASSFPILKKLEILRQRRNGKFCISTTALHQYLGEGLYQECCKHFVYPNEAGYPTPDSVEKFLKGMMEKKPRKRKCVKKKPAPRFGTRL